MLVCERLCLVERVGEVLKQAQDRIKAEGMCRGIKYLAFGKVRLSFNFYNLKIY